MTDNYSFLKNQKPRSKTVTINSHVEPKANLKQSQILKIQSQIRKMKHLLSVEEKLRKDKQELQKVNQKLHQFQEDVKIKRKEAINQQIASIQKRREQRQQYNKQSNAILAKIKMHNKQRRRKMQSLVKEYKQQYDQFYEKKLSQRRQLMKLDLEDIKSHQSGYLKVVKDRNNQRIKTQKCDYSSRVQNEIDTQGRRSVKHDDYEQKRKKILQLVKKRKEYGELAQKQALKIKISLEIVKKAHLDKSKETYDKNIDKYQQQRKKSYKPRLDTNFQGDIQQQKALEMKKIEKQQSPTKEKLTRLKNLADGYLVKFQNGNQEALDKVCNVNLLRAKLLLKDT